MARWIDPLTGAEVIDPMAVPRGVQPPQDPFAAPPQVVPVQVPTPVPVQQVPVAPQPAPPAPPQEDKSLEDNNPYLNYARPKSSSSTRESRSVGHSRSGVDMNKAEQVNKYAGRRDPIAEKQERDSNNIYSLERQSAAAKKEDFTKIYDEHRQGMAESYKKIDDINAEIAKNEINQRVEMGTLVERGEREVAAKRAAYEVQVQKLSAMKVDPTRLGRDNGLAFGLAAFVEGFLGAKGIKVNAMDNINKQIDRDIEAQKMEIETQGRVTDEFKTIYNMAREISQTEIEHKTMMNNMYKSSMLSALEAQKSVVTSKTELAKINLAQAELNASINDSVIGAAKDTFTRNAQITKEAHDKRIAELTAARAQEANNIARMNAKTNEMEALARLNASKKVPESVPVLTPIRDASGKLITQVNKVMVDPTLPERTYNAAQDIYNASKNRIEKIASIYARYENENISFRDLLANKSALTRFASSEKGKQFGQEVLRVLLTDRKELTGAAFSAKETQDIIAGKISYDQLSNKEEFLRSMMVGMRTDVEEYAGAVRTLAGPGYSTKDLGLDWADGLATSAIDEKEASDEERVAQVFTPENFRETSEAEKLVSSGAIPGAKLKGADKELLEATKAYEPGLVKRGLMPTHDGVRELINSVRTNILDESVPEEQAARNLIAVRTAINVDLKPGDTGYAASEAARVLNDEFHAVKTPRMQRIQALVKAERDRKKQTDPEYKRNKAKTAGAIRKQGN